MARGRERGERVWLRSKRCSWGQRIVISYFLVGAVAYLELGMDIQMWCIYPSLRYNN